MSSGQININLGDSEPQRRFRKRSIFWFLLAVLIGAVGSRYISNKFHSRKIDKINKVLLENQRAIEVQDSIILDLEERRSIRRAAYESEIEDLKEILTLEKSKRIIEKVYVPSGDSDAPTITIDEGQAEAIVLDRKELEFLRVELATCNELVLRQGIQIENFERHVADLERKNRILERKAKRQWVNLLIGAILGVSLWEVVDN